MIDFYFWPTPNGHKVTLFLEEAGLDYRMIPVDIRAGDQFKPEFLAIAPNNRMPAIVDHAPAGGGEPISVFESGAILVYLAEKTGQFLSSDARLRSGALQWLFWQMGGLGPMAGQNFHFSLYAAERIPYAVDRYVEETGRLYGVLDKQLAGREFISGDYSIADMASYPWIRMHEYLQPEIGEFRHLRRWLDAVGEREGTIRAYARANEIGSPPGPDELREMMARRANAGVL